MAEETSLMQASV